MGELGGAIRNQRRGLNLKAYELAQKIGVHPTYITYIEKHDRLPSLEIVAKLEKILKINLQDLYFKEKHPSIPQRYDIRIDLENKTSIFIDVKAMGPDITEKEAVYLINEALEHYIKSKRKKSWTTRTNMPTWKYFSDKKTILPDA